MNTTECDWTEMDGDLNSHIMRFYTSLLRRIMQAYNEPEFLLKLSQKEYEMWLAISKNSNTISKALKKKLWSHNASCIVNNSSKNISINQHSIDYFLDLIKSVDTTSVELRIKDCLERQSELIYASFPVTWTELSNIYHRQH